MRNVRWSWLPLALAAWSATLAVAQPQDGLTDRGSDAALVRVHDSGPLEPLPSSVSDGESIRGPTDNAGLPAHAHGVAGGSFWSRLKARLQWSHWGYPEEFGRVPPGTSVRAHAQLQIANGLAARLILYRCDFCDGAETDAPRLNDHGWKRLNELLAVQQCWGSLPLVIEATPDQPQVDAARRQYVMNQLEQAHVPAKVVIGVPLVPGVPGVEATELNTRLLQQVRSGGTASGGTASGSKSGSAAPASGAAPRTGTNE